MCCGQPKKSSIMYHVFVSSRMATLHLHRSVPVQMQMCIDPPTEHESGIVRLWQWIGLQNRDRNARVSLVWGFMRSAASSVEKYDLHKERAPRSPPLHLGGI